MKMRTALFLLLLCTISAAAQEHPAVAAQANTVYVGADGKFETPPDTAQVQFNIAAQEESAKAAYERASRNAQQIRQILGTNGIEAKAAEIGFFSLQPVYEWKTAKRKLVGYRVNASVSLKLRDFSKIAPILQQLAEGDITDNQSVNYTLENIDAAKQKAVEDAYRRARANADAVARAGGRGLGELSYASVDTFEQVRIVTPLARPMAMMRAQGAETPAPTEEFSPQSVIVTAHVNAMFTLK
ncbi:MAG TPA: SIMPL domain-containing protein [Terriglobales bacterium]